jgi:very-short-patch-repair endonuclease
MEELQQRARQLRQNMTEAERTLWHRIRSRQLSNTKFRRQFIVGTYIVDFICLEHRLIIEIDGGQHAQNKSYDDSRSEYLSQQGFMVLRFWNHEVLSDMEAVLEVILNNLVQSAQRS